jgi:hypothetical protein
MKANDYANVVLQILARVTPIRRAGLAAQLPGWLAGWPYFFPARLAGLSGT